MFKNFYYLIGFTAPLGPTWHLRLFTQIHLMFTSCIGVTSTFVFVDWIHWNLLSGFLTNYISISVFIDMCYDVISTIWPKSVPYSIVKT